MTNDWDQYQKDLDNGTATWQQAQRIGELDREKGYTSPTTFNNESSTLQNHRDDGYNKD